VGVEYTRRGRGGHSVRAGEVIVCGGAINSPQLLQLSGIGGAEDLRAHGIDVVSDLPGVGENLQDHLEVYVQHSSTQPVTVAPYFALKRRPLVGAEWLFRRSGPGATNHFEAGGFVRGNEDVKYPNLMYHFLPIAVRYDGTLPEGGGHGYQVHVGPMYSDVRGTCKTDEQILDWVAKDAETALHPSCTCRMGTDDMSVVDPLTMGVHGTEGLRLVDASVFPYVTNGNIYAPVMMTAEKAADLILGNTPLGAEPVEFYRHGVSPSPLGETPAAPA
jgi:choline dehydrogenase